MLHELWIEAGNATTFCHAGKRGDAARSLLSANARCVWTVEAASWAEASQKYYDYMGWGEYTLMHPEDALPYDQAADPQ